MEQKLARYITVRQTLVPTLLICQRTWKPQIRPTLRKCLSSFKHLFSFFNTKHKVSLASEVQ